MKKVIKVGERVERHELRAAYKSTLRDDTARMARWRTDTIYFPRDLHHNLNIHDPEGKYRWANERASSGWLIWTMRALGVLGLFTGIYCLVFLGMLL
jgi:hypothetical protein